MKKKFLSAFTLCTAVLAAACAVELKFADFGGCGDNRTDNIEALEKALVKLRGTPGASLSFEPGVYRFGSRAENFNHERYHKIFSGLDGNTIDGNGATLMFTGEDGGFFFNGCRDVTFKNVVLDWDPLPYTQGEIVSVDPEKPFEFTFRPEPGYPGPVGPAYTPGRKFSPKLVGYVYDPKSRLLHAAEGRNNHKNVGRIETLDDNLFRVTIRPETKPDGIAPGRLFAIVPRNWCALGLAFEDCVRPKVEGVTMYSSPMYGIMFRNSASPRVSRTRLMLKPGTGRLLATNADGLFFDGGPSGPTVENCLLQGVMDDGIVVMVNNGKILRHEDDRSVIVNLFWRTSIRPGDRLEGIDAGGNRTGALPPVEFVGPAQDIPGLGTGRLIRFSAPLPELKNIVKVFNLDMCNRNFTIRDNFLLNIRGKGLKLHGENGLAENNTILNCTFGGIEIGYQTFKNNVDFIWAENIVVRNNRIEGSGSLGLQEPRSFIGWEPGIRIHQGPDHFTGRPNRNITISGNYIGNSAQSAIRAWATEGLRITGNRIGVFNSRNLPTDGMAIDLINISAGTVKDNVLSGGGTVLRIAEDCRDITESDNRPQH